MKQFACGSVVPGCNAVFHADDENAILTQVADHAKAAHGLAEITPEMVDAVRQNIETVT